jgi:hypothetical protein
MGFPAVLNPGYAALMLLCNEFSLFSGWIFIGALHWHPKAQVSLAARSSQSLHEHLPSNSGVV